MPDDLYATLEVMPNADLERIQAAYRRLARQFHPDVNPRPEAAERMRAINAAYRILSDPAQRAAYDARRYLPRTTVATAAVKHPQRWVITTSAPREPSPLERRADRIVMVAGILLVVVFGIFSAFFFPRIGSPSDSPHQASLDVPQRLRSDVGLRNFPGTVLVAPASLQPFASLPILRLDATGQGIARYAVYYGDLTTGTAAISGLPGRAAFDSALPQVPGCASSATYCAGPAPGESASDPPGLEIFRGPDLVTGSPAFVSHRVCCNGVFWSVDWYEPSTNMTYMIDLTRNVASQFGSPKVEHDVAAAHAVAALAGRLVRLP